MRSLSVRPILFALLLLSVPSSVLDAQPNSSWRSATPAELQSALPARAQVEKERIETEMRTASGIIDTHGKIIAGIVLITAGYSADGKYSHYLFVQSPISIGDVYLPAGNYVLGWQRVDDNLLIKFYDAATGDQRGATTAHRLETGHRVESFRIWPPSAHPFIQIGRFTVPYALGKQTPGSPR
jgi:hypothetical protein